MKINKLLKKAINNPRGLRFSEFQNLLEHYGFICTRTRESHFLYSHNIKNLFPFKKGYAKGCQAGQFIKILEDNNVI